MYVDANYHHTLATKVDSKYTTDHRYSLQSFYLTQSCNIGQTIMSFDFNLSSDDEENFEQWSGIPTQGFGADVLPAPTVITPFAADVAARTNEAVSPFDNEDQFTDDDDEDESSEEEEVFWEDADNDDSTKPAAATSTSAVVDLSTLVPQIRPVQIDFGNVNKKTGSRKRSDERSNSERKRNRRRIKFRVESFPVTTQAILYNLQRSHLLALASSAVYVSKQCADPDLLSIAFSLIPDEVMFSCCRTSAHPPVATVDAFVHWYCDLVHNARQRREQRRRSNLAAGAPRAGRRRKARARATVEYHSVFSYIAHLASSCQDDDLQLDDNEEENISDSLYSGTPRYQVQLLLAMTRSMGWRARYVQALDPISADLDIDHPLLGAVFENFFAVFAKQRLKKKSKVSQDGIGVDSWAPQYETISVTGWVEVLCSDAKTKSKHRWVHVDTVHRLFNEPSQVEILLEKVKGNTKSTIRRGVIAYALGVEHCSSLVEDRERLRVTDVTPRYALSWIATLRMRGIVRSKKTQVEQAVKESWWSKTLQSINDRSRPHPLQKSTVPGDILSGTSNQDAIVLGSDQDNYEDRKPAAVAKNEDPMDVLADHESDELQASAANEAIPTSKEKFRTHPLYVIPSVLGKAEVLAPDASERVCGVFKGQLVYNRRDVSTAFPAKKWLYEGRKVLDKELKNPIKRVKARKKTPSANFKPLRSYGVGNANDGSAQQRATALEEACQPLADGTEDLYAKWQTEAWSPTPVGPNDEIPVNEYKNIELALLNPGLVHVDVHGLAPVAKKLGIPYAPCLLGFEGHGGNRTPTIRGIVVHEHNEELIQSAGAEFTSYKIQKDDDARRNAILLRWKRLMVSLLTKDRLDREYGETD
jgi:Rad4 beta-hairpin domain 3/Rad4 beta-hairpin domain 1/Rad4 beta-hairpin domain 2/Rad4 transglutaminase-like domain